MILHLSSNYSFFVEYCVAWNVAKKKSLCGYLCHVVDYCCCYLMQHWVHRSGNDSRRGEGAYISNCYTVTTRMISVLRWAAM